MKKLNISYLFLFLSFSLGSDTMSRTVVVVVVYMSYIQGYCYYFKGQLRRQPSLI